MRYEVGVVYAVVGAGWDGLPHCVGLDALCEAAAGSR